MPEEKIDQNHPAPGHSELHTMQQSLGADTVGDSFPASDPPAWTKAGAKSVAAERDADEAPAHLDTSGRNDDEGVASRVVDQATGFAQEAYRRGGENLEQHRGFLPDVQQVGRAVALPFQNYPVTALIAAGAVGYGLAWLIHRGTGRATSSWSAGHGYTPAQRTSLNTAHPEGENHDKPWPSGDSPKRHGDKLPNTVKISPDNRDRY